MLYINVYDANESSVTIYERESCVNMTILIHNVEENSQGMGYRSMIDHSKRNEKPGSANVRHINLNQQNKIVLLVLCKFHDYIQRQVCSANRGNLLFKHFQW